MVTSRSTSAKSRRWSCHCPQGRGERTGCAQLPCRPKRAIRHLRSPAVEVWGTKVRTTSMRILRSCCFIPLSHSWSISACPIPGKCSSSAPSVQHLACITFAVKGGCYLVSHLYLPFLPTNMTLRLAELLVQSLLSSPHQFPFHGTAAFSSSSLHWWFRPKFHATHLSLISFFFPSQTISAICWIHLNSHPVVQYIRYPS